MTYASLPVYNTAEIVVCGGGTAGSFAAIAAAREGKRVLLLEQFGLLGGSATAGLVTPLMSVHIPGDPHCSYLAEEVEDRLRALHACNDTGRSFDPMMLKIVLEQMCVEAGVRLLYYTVIADAVVKNRKIDALVVANKKGLSLVRGNVFIDCTGDGDVAAFAGASYTCGNPDTGKNQPMSLRYLIERVDMQAFYEFVEARKKETGIQAGVEVSRDGTWAYLDCDNRGDSVLNGCFHAALEEGLLQEEDFLYWQGFSVPGRPGCIAFNCPEFFEHINGTEPDDLTRAQVEGKRRILRHLQFYRKYFGGFEHAVIGEIAQQVGIRETREIAADYVLASMELWGKKKFPDMICQSNYPIDVHGRVLSNQFLGDQADDGMPWYDIPYRALVVKELDNLLVAGRCIGADFYAQASIRIQKTCRSTGEAAGIAAAMALDEHKTPHEIEGAKVRKKMMEKGARYAAL